MEINRYIEMKKRMHQNFLDFIEKEEDIEENYGILMKTLRSQEVNKSKKEFKTFFYLIAKVANNHARSPVFFKKLEIILFIFKDKIKEFFTNTEIFDFFKGNKKILLFLIEDQLITIDESIAKIMTSPIYTKQQFPQYFYPEIESFLDENIIKTFSIEISENFEEKRKTGENDDIISEMIRKDSIEEFITYANQNLLPLSTTIKPSIFETNSFLLKKGEVTLIEYSAFFGSIQIFKYLYLNGAKVNKSIWIDAIHSNNPEMLYFLIEEKIGPDDETYEECFKEAIKCHHNEIAYYIRESFMDDDIIDHNIEKNYKKNILAYCFHYYNYNLMPKRLQNKFVLFYACQYDYLNIVNILLKRKKVNINKKIILKHCF